MFWLLTVKSEDTFFFKKFFSNSFLNDKFSYILFFNFSEKPSGSKFVSFKHEGGFETDIGKYGVYYCSGSMFYNKDKSLEDMTYACEFRDQLGEKFYSRGKRVKGSQSDRSVGIMNIYEGEGYWQD